MVKKYYASVCVIAQNDVDLLEIFIPFYRHIGFEHIYLIDNNSIPALNTYDFIKKYIDEKFVTHIPFEQRYQQMNAYNQILNTYRYETEWLAYFDTDEYLVMKNHTDIKILLKDYENFGSLCICWYCFGSNGHIEYQHDIFNAYTKRVINSYHYKTIVNTNKIIYFGVHNVVTHTENFHSVDEKKNYVKGPFTLYQNTDIVQLNHYVIRSKKDFDVKMSRSILGNPKNIRFFNYINDNSNIYDDTVINFINKTSFKLPDISSECLDYLHRTNRAK